MKNKEKGFFKYVLPYFIIGAVVGFVFAILDLNGAFENLTINNIQEFLITISPYILIVLGLIMSLILIIVIKKSNKDTKNLSDEEYKKLDRKLSYALALSNAMLFSMLILFGISFYDFMDREVPKLLFIMTLILYFIYIYIASISQSKIVNIVKKMDPLKKGNVYDKNFSKEWLDSCDEMEKQLMYEVGFKTYGFMNILLISLLVILIILGMFIKVGIFSIILVGLLAFIQTMVYTYYSIKLDK
ncbi:MAG: DUF3169 family protein [Firmicutes bacterium]|nr:DUF3169 family protein [Bacillota bacterium]